MPRIVEYTAPTSRINPSDRPQAAWETAGRRVGPLYNQAAQDIKQAGAVQGAMERDKIWPFDIYALEASNAPQVHNSSSSDTSVRPAPVLSGGGGGRGRSDDGWGSTGGLGTTSADYANQYANAGYATTPESAANAQNDWTAAHGEASAGAVGMSKMARAATKGQKVTMDSLAEGKMWGSINGKVSEIDPEHEGNILDNYDSVYVNGAWHETPYHGMQQRMQQQAEHADNRAYTLQERQRVIDDRYQRGVDKWNREKAAADKADWMRFNGPNGFNTRRDQWINGKGGLEDQWQKDYNADIQQRANQQIDQTNRANKGVEGYAPYRRNDPRIIDELRTYPNGRVQDAPPPTHTPGGAINYLKNMFGSMFSSTLEDGNEDEY